MQSWGNVSDVGLLLRGGAVNVGNSTFIDALYGGDSIAIEALSSAELDLGDLTATGFANGIVIRDSVGLECGIGALNLNVSGIGIEVGEYGSLSAGPVSVFDAATGGLIIREGASAEIAQSTISGNGGFTGLALYSGAILEVSENLSIDGYTFGVLSTGDGLPHAIRGDVTVEDCPTAIWIHSGNLWHNNGDFLAIGQNEGVGVIISSGSYEEWGPGVSRFSGYDTGIRLDWADSAMALGNIEIHNSQIDGIYVGNSDFVRIDGLRVLSSVQDGITVYLSSYFDFSNLDIDDCGLSGICLRNEASGRVRGSRIHNNGVFVDENSTVDVGDYMDPGGNVFSYSAKSTLPFFIANMNEGSTVNAHGNLWGIDSGLSCPPDPLKILGAVSVGCD
ncbi:hypothetical protein DRQ50_04075 [bacterium]|nr:MAG: hypothetical protein DRQ50_04075 [bacterium]